MHPGLTTFLGEAPSAWRIRAEREVSIALLKSHRSASLCFKHPSYLKKILKGDPAHLDKTKQKLGLDLFRDTYSKASGWYLG